MIKISVIIATYNRPDMLELVLKSLMVQCTGPGLAKSEVEVLVADDGSGAATRELISKFQQTFPFRLVHIWHEDQGFRLAAIRNLAITKALGEYLIFIDGDCILARDFIYNQFKLSEPGYFVGGNRVLLSQAYTLQVLASQDISIASTNLVSAIMHKLKAHSNKWLPALRLNLNAKWRKAQEYNWRRPKGCNMALWRTDCMRVNGFDESFSGWGHEDADFLVRLLHAGIKIKDGRFAVPVYHLWHPLQERSQESKNLQRLLSRVKDLSCIRAHQGLDQYQ